MALVTRSSSSSSPSSTKGIPIIPPELLLEILELTVTRDNFHSISVVCKQWALIVQSLLLRIIQIDDRSICRLGKFLDSRPSELTCIKVILLDGEFRGQNELLQRLLDVTAAFLLELRLATQFWVVGAVRLSGFRRLKDLQLCQCGEERAILSDVFPELPYISTLRTIALSSFKLNYRIKDSKNHHHHHHHPTLSPQALSIVNCTDSNPELTVGSFLSPLSPRLNTLSFWSMANCLHFKHALLDSLTKIKTPLRILEMGIGEFDLLPETGLTNVIKSFGTSLEFLELFLDRDTNDCRLPTSFLSSLPSTLINLSITGFDLSFDDNDNLFRSPKGEYLKNLQRLRFCGPWSYRRNWTKLISAPTFSSSSGGGGKKIQIIDEISGDESGYVWRKSPCLCDCYRRFGCKTYSEYDILPPKDLSCQFCSTLL